MNGKEFGRRDGGLILRYYPGIRLEGLKKTTKLRIVGLWACQHAQV
jgi:hypothetical protein